jgi:hypothetical protein
MTCRRIIDLAGAMGTRAVADGVQSQADLLAVRKWDSITPSDAELAAGEPDDGEHFARAVLGRGAPWSLA